MQSEENEKDGSDSNCSDSVGGGGAFRPTGGSQSPKESNTTAGSYPSPNISVGPPIHPPPHLLPYLYPHGIYPPPPLSLLHNPAMNHGINPGLFLNAQLALAAQHPALFGHYSGHSPTSPLHSLKAHRFSPYSLHGSLGSAFDAVTPGSVRSLSNSPPPNRAPSNSPPNRPLSSSPAPTPPAIQSSAFAPHNHSMVSVPNNNNTSLAIKSNSPSELKSIEKMVNGLEAQNGSVTVLISPNSSIGSPEDPSKTINLDQ